VNSDSEWILDFPCEVLLLYSDSVPADSFRPVCWDLREHVCKLSFIDSPVLLFLLSQYLLNVISVPRCSGIFNIQSLLLELLKLLDFLWRRHGDLKLFIVRELVGLNKVLH
jgi:hypothetical protein